MSDARGVLEKAKSQESKGKYDFVFDLLTSSFHNIDNPDVLEAELCLRYGAITVYIGNNRQIPNAQIKAQEYLSRAREIFLEEKNFEKVAECENYLSLSFYYRGLNSDAVFSINSALEINKTINETRLHSYLIKSMIFLIKKEYQSAVEFLDSVEDDFNNGSYLMRGSFATNKSLAYKNIGDLDKAYYLLGIARQLHIKSKHLPYLASVENNLALVFNIRREFSKALKASENAIKIYSDIGDSVKAALAIETKAETMIELGDFETAVHLCDEALEKLKSGDNSSIISSIYLTKAIALLHSHKSGESLLNISRSIQLATIDGEQSALKVAETFLPFWKSKSISKLFLEAEKDTAENISLEFPDGVTINGEFHGVLVKNNNLFNFGITKGVIAIVLETEIEKGDLVAVSEKKSDLVSLGVYDFDSEWEMISLESVSKSEMFDESEVDILGKVIGYAETTPNDNGKYSVTLLD